MGHATVSATPPKCSPRLTLTYDDDATRGKSVENADVIEVRFTSVDAPRCLVEEADFVSDDPDQPSHPR